MSGYLPPHSTEGPQSKLYKPEHEVTLAPDYDKETPQYRLTIPSDAIATTKTLIKIGPEDEPDLITLPALGFGLWGWGDVLTYGWGPSGGYDKNLNEESVADAFDTMFKYFPKVFVDTAEHYGYTDGFSESIFGQNFSEKLATARERVVYATKYFPVPWRHPWTYPDVVLDSLKGSLERCKLGNIDIYQLHGPSHWGFWPRLDTICDALCKAYETGSVKAIGVCNMSIDQTKYIWEYLKERNVPMVSSQIEFSLVRMDPLTSGHIKWCLDHNIAVIAYSPLAVGRLSGKYDSDNLPRGNRNFGHVKWSKLDPIVSKLKLLGYKYKKTPSAIALNWVICKGAIPIPTAKNGEQVKDAVHALGWRLEREDEEALDAVGLVNDWDYNILKHFQNWWWQRG